MAWDTSREVSGGAGGGTAGDVPLAEQAGHLKYLVQVLAQSHTLRLCGGVPQKLFPAEQIASHVLPLLLLQCLWEIALLLLLSRARLLLFHRASRVSAATVPAFISIKAMLQPCPAAFEHPRILRPYALLQG